MGAIGEIRDPLIGTRIDDRYLVKGVLGRGGMGVVYEGVHEQLGRPVAIKVLGAGIAGDPIAVERFLREARTASQLSHGNIVDVSDLGQLPDGRPYLVMARMYGMDLCTLLQREGPQTPRRTAELLRGAAAALDLIHAKGYVHRDVKPENLMHVVREDGSEAVLLLDFGIVGLVSSQAARLTADGTVFGTPAYLPPELIQGEEPDRRADIYSLATVAFELITGRTPFIATNPLRILPMKVLEDPPRMGSVAGYDFPEELEIAMAKGLARDPNDRQQSAGEFVDDIEAVALKQTGGGTSRTALGRPGSFSSSELTRMRGTETTGVEAAFFGSAVQRPGELAESSSRVRAEREPVSLLPAMRERDNSPDPSIPSPLWHRRPRMVYGGMGAAIALLFSFVWLGARDVGPPPSAAGQAPARGDPALAASKPAALATPEPAAPPPAAAAPAAAEARAPEATPTEASAAAPAAPSKPAPVPVAPKAARAPKLASPEPARAAVKRSEPALPPAAANITTTPNGPSATELGQAAQRELIQGHLAAAADLYSQATRVDPRNEPAWRGLGLANERLGRKAEAAKALRKALELSPDSRNAEMLRARLERLSQ